MRKKQTNKQASNHKTNKKARNFEVASSNHILKETCIVATMRNNQPIKVYFIDVKAISNGITQLLRNSI